MISWTQQNIWGTGRTFEPDVSALIYITSLQPFQLPRLLFAVKVTINNKSLLLSALCSASYSSSLVPVGSSPTLLTSLQLSLVPHVTQPATPSPFKTQGWVSSTLSVFTPHSVSTVKENSEFYLQNNVHSFNSISPYYPGGCHNHPSPNTAATSSQAFLLPLCTLPIHSL